MASDATQLDGDGHLHYHYGDAVPVRLGPYRCWFLFHPNHIEQVLTKQAANIVRFERLMQILRQWNGESLLIAEGESWKIRRRKVLPAFRQEAMPDYAQMVIHHTHALVQRWMKKSVDGVYVCDLDREMASHALDIAGITLFGKQLGSQSEVIGHAVHALSEIAYREATSLFPSSHGFSLFRKKEKRQVIARMKGTISAIVSARLQEGDGNYTDLLSMLTTHHEGNQTSIEEDVMSLLIAGHETSGATLTWLLLLLAHHPEALERVQKEIDHVIGQGSIHYGHMAQLPYMYACLQETMRLYPAAYALFCRRATHDFYCGDIAIKAGDLIQLIPYVTHRDPRWFNEPTRFTPDRFLKSDPLASRYAYIPFGAGPRLCIGQSFGMMEVMLTAVTLLQHYQPEVITALPQPSPRFSLRPAGKMIVRWNRRI
ncbi:MAG: cytochrome P450 [Alphaproteobacteria bacterium]|nr:MAG: cytochrome P450 [Alphaproteobacteria bacterium]